MKRRNNKRNHSRKITTQKKNGTKVAVDDKYNGTERLEEKFEYKLSDMFEQKTENPALELKIMVYNINRGMNEDIKNACKALKEYMILVDEIRDTLKAKMHKNDAINKAINDCINNNVLKGFLLRNREAVMHSCLYEYDEEKHIKNEKNISFEEGKEEGKSEEKRDSVLRMLKRHKDIEEIAGDLDVSIDYIKQIEAELLAKA